MNVQCTAKGSFADTTILALMIIAGSRSSCLSFPIWAIVVLMSTTPRWILVSCHVGLMGNVKTILAAILRLRIFQLIGLASKFAEANWTNQCNGSRFCNQSISALPRSAAFATAEIMCFYTTWKFLKILAAPITGLFDFVFGALSRTVNFSGLFNRLPNPPKRHREGLITLGAIHNKPLVRVYWHNLIIDQNVNYVNNGSEAVGAMHAGWDEAEYVPVANERLKFWTKQDRAQLELFNA